MAQGRDSEKFSRPEFEKYLDNIVIDILKKGIRKKITDQEKQDLIVNVYAPCYDQIMYAYASRVFFTTSENPWNNIPHSWRVRAESDVRECFQEYSKQLEIWQKLFVRMENEFFHKDEQIANSVSVSFEKAGLLEKGELIRLDERSTMNVITWIRKFKYVLFDPEINDISQLYEKLVEFAKLTPDEHVMWLSQFHDKTDLYRYLATILPDIRNDFGIRISSFKELKSEHQKFKEVIEKLKMILEEKLK